MIRHIVLLRIRDDVAAPERDAVYGQLRALAGHLDIRAMSFGPNVSPEGLGKGFNDGFTMDFPDAAARDAYRADPAHTVAGARLGGLLQGGADGVLVFDTEV